MTIDRYFEKHGIDKANIVWIARNKVTTKTIIHMISGREIVNRRMPIASLREQLDEEEFYFIGNSTIVRTDHIEQIEGARYHMVDGSILTGTQRMQSVHNYRRQYLSDKKIADEKTWGIGYIDIRKLPFEIMTIMAKKDDLSQKEKYIVKHCTDMLAESMGTAPENITGRPFTEVFPQASPAWEEAFMTATQEGHITRMRCYDRKHDREMYVACYPIKEQTCLCIMLPLTQILEAKLIEL